MFRNDKTPSHPNTYYHINNSDYCQTKTFLLMLLDAECAGGDEGGRRGKVLVLHISLLQSMLWWWWWWLLVRMCMCV